MQKHRKDKLENAIFAGIIALLIVVIILVIGHDVNANVIQGDGALEKENVNFYFGALIVIIFSCIFFIMHAIKAVIPENPLSKMEENLEEFIHKCGERGYSKYEISYLLTKYGWSKEEINKYF